MSTNGRGIIPEFWVEPTEVDAPLDQAYPAVAPGTKQLEEAAQGVVLNRGAVAPTLACPAPFTHEKTNEDHWVDVILLELGGRARI